MLCQKAVLTVNPLPIIIEFPNLFLIDVKVVISLLDVVPSLFLQNLSAHIVEHTFFSNAVHARCVLISLLLLRNGIAILVLL